MSVNVMFSLEMRPHFTGDWEYDDNIATFQGDVDCTLRHPNPRSHLRPRRVTIPMLYIMHVPPAYVYRVGTSPRQPNRFNVRGCNGYSSSTPRSRIVHEYGSGSPRRRRTRSPQRYAHGERYVLTDEEEEEDPVLGSTGSAWMMD